MLLSSSKVNFLFTGAKIYTLAYMNIHETVQVVIPVLNSFSLEMATHSGFVTGSCSCLDWVLFTHFPLKIRPFAPI